MANLGDREPDPEPPTSKKHSTKLVKIENFTGEVKEGFLDAGAGDWIKRLKIQIRLGEMVDEAAWPDSIKMMVVAAHLGGAASTWLIRSFYVLQGVSFDALCIAIREQLRCPLDRLEISSTLGRTNKKANESYADFAHRLSTIAATMNDGEETKATAEDALSTFIKNAWPQHRASLLSCIKTQSDNPWHEMEEAVKYLAKIAGHDGRRQLSSAPPNFSRDKVGKMKRTDHSPSELSGRRSKAPRRDYSNAVCGVCQRRGHTTGYHDQWSTRQGTVVQARLASIATTVTKNQEEGQSQHALDPTAAKPVEDHDWEDHE